MSDVEESDKEFAEWLETCPWEIKEVGLKFPLHKGGKICCYRSTEDPRFHYSIRSYDRNKTGGVSMTLVHGRDSAHPGIMTFGQDPNQLIACNCGKWQMPTEEQIAAIRADLQRKGLLKRPH